MRRFLYKHIIYRIFKYYIDAHQVSSEVLFLDVLIQDLNPEDQISLTNDIKKSLVIDVADFLIKENLIKITAKRIFNNSGYSVQVKAAIVVYNPL